MTSVAANALSDSADVVTDFIMIILRLAWPPRRRDVRKRRRKAWACACESPAVSAIASGKQWLRPQPAVGARLEQAERAGGRAIRPEVVVDLVVAVGDQLPAVDAAHPPPLARNGVVVEQDGCPRTISTDADSGVVHG